MKLYSAPIVFFLILITVTSVEANTLNVCITNGACNYVGSIDDCANGAYHSDTDMDDLSQCTTGSCSVPADQYCLDDITQASCIDLGGNYNPQTCEELTGIIFCDANGGSTLGDCMCGSTPLEGGKQCCYGIQIDLSETCTVPRSGDGTTGQTCDTDDECIYPLVCIGDVNAGTATCQEPTTGGGPNDPGDSDDDTDNSNPGGSDGSGDGDGGGDGNGGSNNGGGPGGGSQCDPVCTTGQTCVDQGNGNFQCQNTAVCGNNLIETTENCDGTALGTCVDCTQACTCVNVQTPPPVRATECTLSITNFVYQWDGRRPTSTHANYSIQTQHSFSQYCENNNTILEIQTQGQGIITKTITDQQNTWFQLPINKTTTLTLRLSATKDSTPITKNQTITITTKEHRICYTNDGYCDGNTKVTCGADGKLDYNLCTGGQMCSVQESTALNLQTTQAVCVNNVPCENCNQLFSNFGESSTITIGDNLVCSLLTQPQSVGGASRPFTACYLSQQETTLRVMNSCSEIVTCTDYPDWYSCNNAQCSVTDGPCSWNETLNICRSDDNSGDVVEEECSAITEQSTCNDQEACMYENNACIPRDTNAYCGYATTQSDCIGEGSNHSINQTTHISQANSSHILGLTKCRWSGSYCVKPKEDGTDAEDATTKITDFENPQMTVYIPEEAEYYPGDFIEYSVTDNADDNPQAFVQINKECTNRDFETSNPDTVTSGGPLRIPIPEVTEFGDYCLEYYALDESYNYQHLQQKTITIRKKPPAAVNLSVNMTKNITGGNKATLKYVITVEEPSTDCSLTVRNSTGDIILGPQPNPKTNLNPGSNITITDVRTTPGRLNATATCTGPDGQEESDSELIHIDFDERIIVHTLDKLYQNTPKLHVETYEEATCTLEDGEKTITLQQSAIGTDGSQNHTNQTINQQTGVYNYNVICDFASGRLTDTLRYAVDNAPPNMTLAGNKPYRINPPTRVRVICEDEKIPGYEWLQGVKLNISREAEGYPDFITLKMSRINFFQYTTTQTNYTFTCTDAVGNINKTTKEVIAADTVAPQRT